MWPGTSISPQAEDQKAGTRLTAWQQALGVTGVAAVASQIAWVLFLIGVVLLVVHLVWGRTPPAI